MPTPPLSDEDRIAVLEAADKHEVLTEAAASLGLNYETFRSRLRNATSWRDRMAFKDELTAKVADGFGLKGYSQYTKTDAGEPIWLKTVKAERDYYAAVIEAINNRPSKAIKIPPPRLTTMDARDVIPWLNIGDAHIGMMAHEAETTANFDLKIAKREILQAAFDLIDSAPDCERMVVNDLGDGTHYENMRAETERSGHKLDADNRFYKMIDCYLDVMESIIEKALTKAKTVDVIINQGNHSETNDYWAAQHFRRMYAKVGNNRVNVLANENPFIGYRMGNTFIMVHHGHKAKPEGLRQIMSSDFAQDWGECTFRYIDGGHVHHFSAKELGGAQWESFNNLAAPDKHAHDGAWRSKQAMTLVLRSRKYGEIGRHKMPIEKVWDAIRTTEPGHYVPEPRRAFSV